jgi:hypothetical protein
VEGVREGVVAFRRSAGQHLRHLEAAADETEKRIQELADRIRETTSEIQSQKGRLDQAIATFQEQFQTGEQARASEVRNAEAKRQEQFTQAQQQRTEAHDQLSSEWKNTLAGLAQEYEKRFEVLAEDSDTTFAEKRSQFDEAAKAALAILNEQREEAKKIVRVIARTGMAGGYQEVADQEGRRALGWHAIGVVAVVGLVVFAIVAFVATLAPDVEWTVFGARLFVAAAFGLLAAYAERQANRHADSERRNRRWQLVLASVNPYLTDLPEERQHEIKALIAEKVFAASEPVAGAENNVGAASLFKLLQVAVENLTKR